MALSGWRLAVTFWLKPIGGTSAIPYPFDSDTYAVLDLPEPVASKVMAIRRKHRDAFRSALPAEITVAGSGGVGCFDPDEYPEHAWDVLGEISASTAPIETAMGAVMRFPGTDLFVIRPDPDDALRALHARIASSSIRFQPNRFPYTPHCTLRGRSPVTDEDAASLLAERIPDRFTLNQMSVYRLEEGPSAEVPVLCKLLRRWSLGSSEPSLVQDGSQTGS
jgi:2'-5' RNA ligase